MHVSYETYNCDPSSAADVNIHHMTFYGRLH